MNIILLFVALIYAAGFVLIVVGARNAISEEEMLGQGSGTDNLSVFRDALVQVQQDGRDGTPRGELCVADSLG